MKQTSDRSLLAVRLAYAGTLLAWLLAAFVPGLRVWGLGFLSPLGLIGRTVVLVCAAGAYLLIETRLADQLGGKPAGSTAGRTDRWMWITVAGASLLFILLHDRTHFLGDSAFRLSTLTAARLRGGIEFCLALPVLKAAQVFWAQDTSALRAYQLVSITSGLLCVLLATHFARKIFDSPIRAWIFAAGVLSAGYLLLFFGYVENYALLVLAVFVFISAGIAYGKRRAGLGWVLLAFGLAVGVDLLAWSLLPALAYLLLEQSSWAPRWRKLSKWVRFAVVSAATGAAGFWIQQLYVTNRSFQYAWLPLFKNRLTVDGYTLLSVAHLLDLLNLVLLLLPGLVVAGVYLISNGHSKTARKPAGAFLGWSLAGAILAVALFDPPLGMPRSWDHLAFAGVPLAAWLYYRLLSLESQRAIAVALLCASLAGLTLLSRAWVQTQSEASVNLAMSYFRLDPGRSRTGVLTVGSYLLDHNTTAAYAVLEDFRREHHPEEGLRERLNFLFRDHKQLEAADVCQSIIRHDPRFTSGWMFLGFIYNNANRFDSATVYLNVAHGLDPHHTGILNELGRAYYFTGHTEQAVELWQESLAEDSLQYVPHLALATWYQSKGNRVEASRELSLAASRPDAPGDTFLELARDHAEGGRASVARAAYEEAMAHGADSAQAAKLLKDHPELGPPVAGTARPK